MLNTCQKLAPLDLGTLEEARRSRYPRPTLEPPTSRGGARKLPINRARFNSEALGGQKHGEGCAKVKLRPSPRLKNKVEGEGQTKTKRQQGFYNRR